MGQPIFDRLSEWHGGVVTSSKSDRLARIASPRGRNSYLAHVGPEGALPAKRRGFSVVNASNGQVAATALIGQAEYREFSSGSFTRRHVLVGAGGQIGLIASDPSGTGTYTSISTGLTANAVPDFAQANNLLFLVNGTDKKKLRGSTLENFGIAPPSTAPTLAAGAAGTPSGTYEARVTFVNGNTGHESSAGPTSSTVTVSSQEIDFTSVPTSADSQVTQRKIYIRNTATQANFYLAVTISDNTTTTATFDAADSTLITLGPDTDENDQLPEGIKLLAWHRSRMFASDGTTLYYSKLENPESFDPEFYEPVNKNDGQAITALYSFGDVLLIFKSRSLYGLFGVDPETWQIRLLSPDVGCVSHRSVVAVENTLYWWAADGPQRMETGSFIPRNIGLPLIQPTISNETLEYSELSDIVTAVEPNQQLILFSVADLDETRNTRILPFSYRIGAWVSDGWNGIEAASFAVVEDDEGRLWVHLGNYNGQVFRLWDADNDGADSGTVTGTFTAGSSSISSITSSGFTTTGQALAERYVSIVDSDGELVAQRRISSNTSTVLTLASAVSVTSGATYTFHVGGPAFEWDTRDEDSNLPFHKKRYEFLHIQVEATETMDATTASVDLFLDYEESARRHHSFSAGSSTQTAVTKRLRVAGTGLTWRARVKNFAANAPLTLYEVAMTGETLTTQPLA